jgi:hypothetical protein
MRHSFPVAKSNKGDRSTGRFGILLTAAVFACLTAFGIQTRGLAAERTQVQTAQGMTVYIGLMPAAIIQGMHPGMHGEQPRGPEEFHVVVAIFDAASGKRISDATVSIRLSKDNMSGASQVLEPMQIAGTVTFGGYVAMPVPGDYVLDVTVTRPASAPASFAFLTGRR